MFEINTMRNHDITVIKKCRLVMCQSIQPGDVLYTEPDFMTEPDALFVIANYAVPLGRRITGHWLHHGFGSFEIVSTHALYRLKNET
jgi:hypothetical protein